MNPQDLDGLKKKAEFDRLMTSAHVYRMRGDYTQARHIIRQALELCPSDLDAREFAADLLFAAGKLEVAAAEYKSICDENPNRVGAEEKFAKATLQIAEGNRQQELLKQMMENPAAFRAQNSVGVQSSKSLLMAILLSSAPGFGQIYCGKLIKGIWIFVASLLSWLLFLASRPNVTNAQDFLREIGGTAIFSLCVGMMVQVYALVDAVVLAEKSQKDQGLQSYTEPK